MSEHNPFTPPESDLRQPRKGHQFIQAFPRLPVVLFIGAALLKSAPINGAQCVGQSSFLPTLVRVPEYNALHCRELIIQVLSVL